VSVSLCKCMSLSVCVCPSVCVSQYLCLSLSVYASLSVRGERVKQVDYSKVGVNEAINSAIQVISDNSAAFKPLLQKVRDTFKESFLGIGWDMDSAFGETDAESLARITTERLPQFLADSGIFDNIFTDEIRKTMEQKDFDKLKNDMATNLTAQLGWTMTTDMVDQMINLLLNPLPKKKE